VNKTRSWELIQYVPSLDFVKEIDKQVSGTSVVWYCLDRNLKDIKEDDSGALGKFMELMESVKNHLEMVFHRFLEQGKIAIWFQDRKIVAWDPFLRGENGIQSGALEYFNNGKCCCQRLCITT